MTSSTIVARTASRHLVISSTIVVRTASGHGRDESSSVTNPPQDRNTVKVWSDVSEVAH